MTTMLIGVIAYYLGLLLPLYCNNIVIVCGDKRPIVEYKGKLYWLVCAESEELEIET